MLAFLHSLECQSSDQSGTYTRTVFGGKDLDWVVALTERLAVATLLPVQDLLQGLSTTLL